MDKLKKFTDEIIALGDGGGLKNAKFYRNIATIMNQLHSRIPANGNLASRSQAPIQVVVFFLIS